MEKTPRRTAVFLPVIAWITMILATSARADDHGRAVVIAEKAPVYAGYDKKEAPLAHAVKHDLCRVFEVGTQLFCEDGKPWKEDGGCIGHPWCRVKLSDGKEGWIFGMNLAIDTKSPLFRGREKHPAGLGADERGGFDIDGDRKSDTLWFAQVPSTPYEGHDIIPFINLTKTGRAHPLGFTLMSYSEGDTGIDKIWLKDVTGDGVDELIALVHTYADADNSQSLHVYGAAGGRFAEVYSGETFHYIAHDYGWHHISRITVARGAISVRSLSYKPLLKSYAGEYPKKSIYRNDRDCRPVDEGCGGFCSCLEMYGERYAWSASAGRFRLVSETNSPVRATVSVVKVNLRDKGDADTGKVLGVMHSGERVKVIRLSENYATINGVDADWALVERKDKKRGWVFSHYLTYEDQVTKEKYSSGWFDIGPGQVVFKNESGDGRNP